MLEEQLEVKETEAPKEKKAAKEKKAPKEPEVVEGKPSKKDKASTKDKSASKDDKKAKKEKKDKPVRKTVAKRANTPDTASDVELVTEKATKDNSASKEGKKVKKAKKDKPVPKVPAKRAITPDTASDVKLATEETPKAKKTKVTATEGSRKSKKSKKETAIAIVAEESDSDVEDDQTAALLAGFESSEDEADASKAEGEGDNEGVDLDHLPDVPASDALKLQLKEAGQSGGEPGVIYVGRVPHGFYEHQMTAYFSQFGHIKRLRLSRNKRTGQSKHYAFIEFASADVADIVARTMNNYLLFQRLLQVRVVPSAQVHEELFKGAGKRFRKPAPRNAMLRKDLEHGSDRKSWIGKVKKEQQKRLEKAEKLKSVFGYEFDVPEIRSVDNVPVRTKAVEAEAVKATAFEAA
ncbi:hypothetical protein BU16DRAFT_537806 [Lophium mytilinum]|uniref:RRM domain-containing protein n=1 Tax=Lophium mytilinum TaxID=390894 RepID=A0A6A6QYC5_9PEZI|nr:hypothetical protein BU16DRAFT_537806 [Lophium mytilinum]